jgi:hypothetical protein
VEAGASVAADQHGNVYLVWHAGAFNEEGQRAVYVRRSTDAGQTFGPEQRANPEATGVCACCGMSAAVDQDGTLYVSYRAARDKIHRDMVLLTSRDGGRTFSTRTIDRWERQGCPVSTTTVVAHPSGAGALLAWETKGRLYWAAAQDPSQAVSVAPDEGLRQKNPALAVTRSQQTLVAWGEAFGWQAGGTLRWQRFDAGGEAIDQPGQAQAPIPMFSVAEALAKPDGQFVIIF